MRIPRKKKKKIPKGHYCYQPDKKKSYKSFSKDGLFTYFIKSCSFFKYRQRNQVLEHLTSIDNKIIKESTDSEAQVFLNEKIGFCKLIKNEIEDQCKSCGFKMDY
jgi:hypothetical protein